MNHAEVFLSLLDPDPQAIFYFRTFSDKPGEKRAAKYSGTFAECRSQLERDNASGRGVFVVVNAGGHTAREINRVRALFADCDTQGKPWTMCAIPGRDPHMVVETSPGKWHAYWRVDGVPIKEFTRMQASISARFATDPSVTDLPRIMRLPGFDHHKIGPFPTKLISWSDRVPYRYAELESQGWEPQGSAAIPQGRRNTELTRIAGGLRNKGAGFEEILAALINVPVVGTMDPGEIERIAKSVSGYPLASTLKARADSGSLAEVGGVGILSGVGGVEVVLLRGDKVAPEPIHWLWPGWLAAGKFHLLAGAPGCGKTTAACSLGAIVTRGAAWPDKTIAPEGEVLIWSGEDDIANTLIPRFMACGAEMSRVHFVGGVNVSGSRQPFDPSVHLRFLEAELEKHPNIRLMIVDPVVSAINGDSHKNVETRRGLQPLVDLVAGRGIALIGITHFSKGTQGRDPTERVTGSVAFSALARVVLIAGASNDQKNSEQSFVIARSKSNIGPNNGGFSYCLSFPQLVGHPDVVGSCVQWGDCLDGNARDILSASEGEAVSHGLCDEAAKWLIEQLHNGPVATRQLQNVAKASGYSWRTLERAKQQIGAVARKNSHTRAWEWSVTKPLEGLKPPPVPQLNPPKSLPTPPTPPLPPLPPLPPSLLLPHHRPRTNGTSWGE